MVGQFYSLGCDMISWKQFSFLGLALSPAVDNERFVSSQVHFIEVAQRVEYLDLTCT